METGVTTQIEARVMRPTKSAEERKNDEYEMGDRALLNRHITKTVHVLLFNPDPHSQLEVFFVYNKPEPNMVSGKTGKPGGWGLPGGGVGIVFAMHLPTTQRWHYYDESGNPLSDAWLEGRGYMPLELNGEPLDIGDRTFNRVVRKYDYGTELTLTVKDREGATKHLLIKPLREETLVEAGIREVRGETGLTIKIVPMPHRDYVLARRKSDLHFDFVLYGILADTTMNQPTETSEIAELVSGNLMVPAHRVFGNAKNKGFIYFGHAKKTIQAIDRLNLLLKTAGEHEPLTHEYTSIWREDIHESWAKYPFNLSQKSKWILLMDDLLKAGVEKITDEFREEYFGPLDGGVEAYFQPRPMTRTFIDEIPAAETPAAEPKSVMKTDETDAEEDAVLTEQRERYKDLALEKQRKADEEYARSLGY